MPVVKLAGLGIEPRNPIFDRAAQLRQDLPAHRVPRHKIRVVLHHRRHDVVARSEIGQQRVHDDVVRLGSVPGDDEIRARRGVDELRDRVVGLLEQRRGVLRRDRLTPMNVFVFRGQGPEQIDELAGRLGARGVVRHDTPRVRKEEMPSHALDLDGGGGGSRDHLHMPRVRTVP